jgi:beta-1,4-mannosyl-glycoprotein beta-1,4-N-acetylglucosaminyltransferase
MIIDAFCFFKEFDLLKIRCECMKHPEVIHVLIESPWTFSGKPKRLYFQDNQEDYRKYNIVHFIADVPNDGDPWHNEKTQRNYIRTAIAKMTSIYPITDDTKIIIADCDEIVDVSKIINWNGELAALKMDKYGYFINVQEGHQSWDRTKICTWRHMKDNTPDEIRNAGFPETIENAGQHFSYLGGLDAIMDKAAAFSHQEADVQKHFTRENIEHKLKTIESLWGTDKWRIVSIDTLPKYIQEHQEELEYLIYKPS